MSKYVDKAIELRTEMPRPNCAQTVMLAFADEMGMKPEKLKLIGTNFGHGMKCGDVCGAVTGALMTLGVLFPYDPQVAVGLFDDFREHNHDVDCEQLLNANRQTNGDQKAFCDELIFDAIRYIESRLAEADARKQ